MCSLLQLGSSINHSHCSAPINGKPIFPRNGMVLPQKEVRSLALINLHDIELHLGKFASFKDSLSESRRPPSTPPHLLSFFINKTTSMFILNLDHPSAKEEDNYYLIHRLIYNNVSSMLKCLQL